MRYHAIRAINSVGYSSNCNYLSLVSFFFSSIFYFCLKYFVLCIKFIYQLLTNSNQRWFKPTLFLKKNLAAVLFIFFFEVIFPSVCVYGSIWKILMCSIDRIESIYTVRYQMCWNWQWRKISNASQFVWNVPRTIRNVFSQFFKI